MKKINKKLEITLCYYKGLVPDSILQNEIKNLNKINISLIIKDKSGKAMMADFQFMNNVYIFFGSEFIQHLLALTLVHVSYDIIKKFIIKIWKSVRNKKLSSIKSSKVVKENINFGIDAQISKTSTYHFRINGELESKTVETCIDKILNFLKEHPKHEELLIIDNLPYLKNDIVRYNTTNEEWEILNLHKEVKKIIKKQKNNDKKIKTKKSIKKMREKNKKS